jgi:hypothetical protein
MARFRITLPTLDRSSYNTSLIFPPIFSPDGKRIFVLRERRVRLAGPETLETVD